MDTSSCSWSLLAAPAAARCAKTLARDDNDRLHRSGVLSFLRAAKMVQASSVDAPGKNLISASKRGRGAMMVWAADCASDVPRSLARSVASVCVALVPRPSTANGFPNNEKPSVGDTAATHRER